MHSVIDGGDHFVVFGAVQSMSEPQAIKKPRPLLFYRGEYTGIEPDKNTPAQWRDDLGGVPHRHHRGHLALSYGSTTGGGGTAGSAGG